MDRLNVDPKIWGPPAWKFIDAVVSSYPVRANNNDKIWMMNFLYVIADALPCASCRANYKNFIALYPVETNIGGRAAVENWFREYKLWSKGRK